MLAIKINSLEILEKVCHDFMSQQIVHDTAHDINHIKRVVKNATIIAEAEKADLWVVKAAAWLHDCVTFAKNDPRNSTSSHLAAKKAVEFLSINGFPEHKLESVFHAVEAHSYSANITTKTLEAEVVQDADRLDGLGAVGIARCFAVSGKLGSKIYHWDDPFCETRTPNSKTSAIDHFYEKLFKTADSMKTKHGKLLAKHRVEFMEAYLNQLGLEID
ncbi:HD domain-containing protein [Psychrosphaera aestuarii]|uniref:HD domain-containing protein n=1 Tax=Psychrosphaera aestuarii TaxID=1266052 RepID=UPI001FD01267|nr:HD domain-containing protein [Psychrosphaera aestuarii]